VSNVFKARRQTKGLNVFVRKNFFFRNDAYKKKLLTLATVEAAMHITLMKNPKQRATSFLRTNVFDPPSFQGDWNIDPTEFLGTRTW
jgi:hypothetical protein